MLGDAIVPRLNATSRRQALQMLVDALAKATTLDTRLAFEAVLIRERLSGTGIGEGVAVPHAHVAGLDRVVGAFARLDPPQDFEALDGRQADLVFLLLSPTGRGADHLKALSRVTRFFRRAEMREKLRGARNAGELTALFAGTVRDHAA